MPSLKSINAEAGTNFRRWKEVPKALIDSRPSLMPGEDQRDNGPIKEEVPVQAVNCMKCGGTLHAEGNYPNLFRCGTCDTVQKLEANEPAPEPVSEAPITDETLSEQANPPWTWERPSTPDFPSKLSDRVAYQMRGRGFTVEDGWPIAGGRGTFTNGDETWKYDSDGRVHIVWNHHSWNEQRKSMYEAIIDQPLLRAGDGSLDPSMFEAHHGWIDYMSEYRDGKLDAVREGVSTFAEDRVAWFQDGIPIYHTTIGALLAKSLSLRE